MATHSSILAWKIPWTEEPGELQSMRLQRVRHDLATKKQQQFNGEGWWGNSVHFTLTSLSATDLNCPSCLPCPQSSLQIPCWTFLGPWSIDVVAGPPSGFPVSLHPLPFCLSPSWPMMCLPERVGQGDKYSLVHKTEPSFHTWSCDPGLRPWLTSPQRGGKAHPPTPRSFPGNIWQVASWYGMAASPAKPERKEPSCHSPAFCLVYSNFSSHILLFSCIAEI